MISRMPTRSQQPPRLSPGLKLLRRVTRRRPRNRLHLRLLQATYLRMVQALPRQRHRKLPPLAEVLAMRELRVKRLPQATRPLRPRLLRRLRKLHQRPRPLTTSSKVSPIF